MKKSLAFMAFLCCPPLSFAQAGAVQQPGMVIKGDQEAPLVLYIVPWQEPKPPALPEVPQQTLLPKVLDDNNSLADDPMNRSTTLALPASTAR